MHHPCNNILGPCKNKILYKNESVILKSLIFKIVDRALAWEEWNIPGPKAMWGIILYISYIYLWALSKIWRYIYLCVRFNKNYPFTVCKYLHTETFKNFQRVEMKLRFAPQLFLNFSNRAVSPSSSQSRISLYFPKG